MHFFWPSNTSSLLHYQCYLFPKIEAHTPSTLTLDPSSGHFRSGVRASFPEFSSKFLENRFFVRLCADCGLYVYTCKPLCFNSLFYTFINYVCSDTRDVLLEKDCSEYCTGFTHY